LKSYLKYVHYLSSLDSLLCLLMF